MRPQSCPWERGDIFRLCDSVDKAGNTCGVVAVAWAEWVNRSESEGVFWWISAISLVPWCWSPLQIIVHPQRWCTICHCLTWYQISSQKLPFPLSSCHLEDTVLIKILSAPLALVFLYLCLWLKKLLTSDKETQHVREGGPSCFGESGQAIKINQIVTVRDAKSVMNMK